MSLATTLAQRLDDPALDVNERALLRCQIAGEMENIGDYEAARVAMSGLWQRVGERPQVDSLARHVAAEVLLRAGTLSGFIGSAQQVADAQEKAKDLLSESQAIFTELNNLEKAAEASNALAVAYWREGANNEALDILRGVLNSPAVARNKGELR
ncbi:MAG: hypothetical protein JOZ52_00595, partial [Acidobacteria bacterium]|nr:hypothetical protein [Acidobacteriota bacterium]